MILLLLQCLVLLLFAAVVIVALHVNRAANDYFETMARIDRAMGRRRESNTTPLASE